VPKGFGKNSRSSAKKIEIYNLMLEIHNNKLGLCNIVATKVEEMNEVETKVNWLFKVALFALGIGIAIPVFGINLAPAVAGTFYSIASAIFAVGMVMYWRMKKGQKVIRDERVNRVAQKASSWSWFLSYVLITILFWVQYLKLYALTVELVLGLMFYFMVFSYIICQWYLNRQPNL